MAGENFDDAFALLSKEDKPGLGPKPDATPPTPTPPPAATPPVTPPAAQAAAEPPADPEQPDYAEPVTELEDPAAEGDPEPAEPPETPEPPKANDDALARLAEMIAQRDAQRTAAPAPAVQQPPASVYTPEEVGVLTQYRTDYPDVQRAEALIRRQEYVMLTTHIFKQMTDYLAPKLALLDQVADTTAYGEITQRIPDYETIRAPVIEWVKTQPGYLQPAMNHVIEHGTPEEIEHLFGSYRQATGAASPQPKAGIAPQPQAGRQASPPPAQAAELSPQAKQAAQRLAPVNSKRSAPTQAAPANFDAAFSQFADELMKAG